MLDVRTYKPVEIAIGRDRNRVGGCSVLDTRHPTMSAMLHGVGKTTVSPPEKMETAAVSVMPGNGDRCCWGGAVPRGGIVGGGAGVLHAGGVRRPATDKNMLAAKVRGTEKHVSGPWRGESSIELRLADALTARGRASFELMEISASPLSSRHTTTLTP
jgi:hypothetical protein